MAADFKLVSPFEPAGDQPKAIEQLVAGYRSGKPFQVLLGAATAPRPACGLPEP